MLKKSGIQNNAASLIGYNMNVSTCAKERGHRSCCSFAMFLYGNGINHNLQHPKLRDIVKSTANASGVQLSQKLTFYDSLAHMCAKVIGSHFPFNDVVSVVLCFSPCHFSKARQAAKVIRREHVPSRVRFLCAFAVT